MRLQREKLSEQVPVVTYLLPFNSGRAGYVADSSWRFYGKREIFALEPESHIHQADKNRHFQERADNCGKSLARVDSENGDGNRNGQFEVVRSSRETQGG